MTDLFLDTAIKAARAAGDVLIEGRKSDIKVDQQMRRDVKLEMDRKAEAAIVGVLQGVFPDHDILAEESGLKGVDAEYQWVIDPLDGTYNFFRGIPIWCSSIGLRHNGEEVLGVIFDPCQNEMFYAQKGEGAYLNGRPINVSNIATLAESTVAVAYGPCELFLERMRAGVNNVFMECDKVRGLGAAALHLAYVACGRFDAFFEYGIWPWDVVAGNVMIREAGGEVSMLIREDGMVEICASNGRIHDELMPLIEWE
jgi:myo-inositol-1(or 4)-monophosphatase